MMEQVDMKVLETFASGLWVQIPLCTPYGVVMQLVDIRVSKTWFCGFESHRRYHLSVSYNSSIEAFQASDARAALATDSTKKF